MILLTVLRRLTLNLTDGLVWGGSSLVPVGFGIKKLQINLVVEDDKISLEELQQDIEGDEDHVQSTDVSRNPIIPNFRRANTFGGLRLQPCRSCRQNSNQKSKHTSGKRFFAFGQNSKKMKGLFSFCEAWIDKT